MSNIDSENRIRNDFNNEGYVDENDPNVSKKRRRRRPNPNLENNPNDVEEVNNDTPKKRHRRRRKDPNTETEIASTNHIGLAAHLEDLQDDIEIRAANDEISTADQLTTSRGKLGTTVGGGDTVYVEGSRKFRAENQEKYMSDKLKESQKMSDRLNLYEDRYDNDLMQCAITITERFRILATFIHGLFSGLVLMYSVFSLIAVNFLSNQTNIAGILSLYSTIQQPFSIFNYLIFIFIGVSIMDRCNMGRLTTDCNQQQGGTILALILILIAFVLNNALYYYNPFFNQYKANVSFSSYLITYFPAWSIVDVIKSVLVCVAWFVIALIPVYDRFVDNLRVELKDDNVNEGTSDRR